MYVIAQFVCYKSSTITFLTMLTLDPKSADEHLQAKIANLIFVNVLKELAKCIVENAVLVFLHLLAVLFH